MYQPVWQTEAKRFGTITTQAHIQHNVERDIIQKCLHDASKVITFKDEMWDILIDYEVSTLPNDRNFKKRMIEAAKKYFSQKPFYI